MEDNDDISDDGKNLWSNLLQEVKEKSSKTRHIPYSLLVLGNELSGKSSLISRLQKADLKNGVGLEFEFIDVKDESMDENKELNVWISSGDTFHSNLLKYALDENNFEFTLCMITISFGEPWAIIESLEQWLEILKKHIDRLKLDRQSLTSFKESLSHYFQEYVEPEIDTVVPVVVGKRRDTDFNHLHPIVTEDSDKISVPLGNGILDKNLGIPIIVVITKTDQISTLENEYHYDDDKFDFIQMNIRKLCLKYGAALCYTSLKDGHNCEILLKYILHRCYGFPFIDVASVIEKDAIFIPAGWDNINKINILADNLPEDTRNQKFDAFITKPVSLVRAAAQIRMSEPEMPEDEQVFLMKQQAQLQRIKASGVDPNLKSESSRGVPSSKGSSVASSGSGRNRKNLAGQASVGVNNPNPGVQANEGVLANFFSSLLNKRAVPGDQPLQNQQAGTEDMGKQIEMTSESDRSLKEEMKMEEIVEPVMVKVEERNTFSESSPAQIPKSESNEPKLSEEISINDSEIVEEITTKDVLANDEKIEEANTEIQETVSVCTTKPDEDIEHVSEVMKCEDIEIEDDNSTGKQVSEMDDTAEMGDDGSSKENQIETELEKDQIEKEFLSESLEQNNVESIVAKDEEQLTVGCEETSIELSKNESNDESDLNKREDNEDNDKLEVNGVTLDIDGQEKEDNDHLESQLAADATLDIDGQQKEDNDHLESQPADDVTLDIDGQQKEDNDHLESQPAADATLDIDGQQKEDNDDLGNVSASAEPIDLARNIEKDDITEVEDETKDISSGVVDDNFQIEEPTLEGGNSEEAEKHEEIIEDVETKESIDHSENMEVNQDENEEVNDPTDDNSEDAMDKSSKFEAPVLENDANKASDHDDIVDKMEEEKIGEENPSVELLTNDNENLIENLAEEKEGGFREISNVNTTDPNAAEISNNDENLSLKTDMTENEETKDMTINNVTKDNRDEENEKNAENGFDKQETDAKLTDNEIIAGDDSENVKDQKEAE